MDNFNWNNIFPWLLTGGASMIGRLMFHAKQVQRGKRRPISWTLLWDIPIALGTGWIALGVCEWLNVHFEITVSAAIVAGYLGPYGIDAIFDKWLTKKD